MAFIANNIVVTGNNSANLVVNVPPSAALPDPVDTNQANNIFYDKDHHILIVNGKPKKISKQSAYLLDMLTLDN